MMCLFQQCILCEVSVKEVFVQLTLYFSENYCCMFNSSLHSGIKLIRKHIVMGWVDGNHKNVTEKRKILNLLGKQVIAYLCLDSDLR